MKVVPARVPTEMARPWVEQELAGGVFAATLSPRLDRFAYAWLVVPFDKVPVRGLRLDDGVGVGTTRAEADAALEWLLAQLFVAGARAVVVEDDILRRGDQLPPVACVSYAGDRVVWWSELTGDASRAVRTVAGGSTGYPLNGFACATTPDAAGLVHEGDLDAGRRDLLAGSAIAIVVSVFDATAYVALTSDPLT